MENSQANGIIDIMAKMEASRMNEIAMAVERLRLGTGLSYPENSLINIAESLGIEVVSADLPNFNGKKVKGYIEWYEDNNEHDKKYGAKIYLNSDQFETTKNFTFAHELGHFLLHKEKDSFRIDLQDYSPEGDPKNQETEANYFAGVLLMPRAKFETALKAANSLDQVAHAFGVSVPAVESRIKWLGLSIANE